MISLAVAKALIAEAQAWINGLNISLPRQALWAESLAKVSQLEAGDVRTALERIATTTREGYWRLEIAEILDVSKKVMRERIALTTPAAPQLPETAAGLDEERVLRTRVAARLARDMVLGVLPPDTDYDAELERRMKTARVDDLPPPPESELAPARKPQRKNRDLRSVRPAITQTLEEANAARARLHAQKLKLEDEAMVDAFTEEDAR